jgi:phosphatidate cytidylyltransferase
MIGADPAGHARSSRPGGDLLVRFCSALVLAPLAILTAYLGGWIYLVFWAGAALLVLWEWTSLVSGVDRRGVLITGGASVAMAALLAGVSVSATGEAHDTRFWAAVTILALGGVGTAALAAREQRLWTAAGIPYAGCLGIAPIVLRSDVELGFLAIVFLFAIVWATDIVAYFSGRLIGGPRLSPRISPKKTWSGAVGGTVAAAAAGIGIALAAGLSGKAEIGILSVLLSVVSQVGDLMESAVKRRFGAKDSSQLIPGHGGLMDRLDSFVAAAVLALVIGLLRGGLEAPARGLLVW